MPKYHPNINISGQIDRFSVIGRQMCLIPRAILQDNRANMPNTNKLGIQKHMESDIELPNPFNICMDVLEIECSHVSSFRCIFSCKYIHPTGVVTYKANDIWIETDVVDKFHNNLMKLLLGERKEAELYDMSSYISYKVTLESIVLNIHELNGIESTANIKLESDIDYETIQMHVEHLGDYPKWW